MSLHQVSIHVLLIHPYSNLHSFIGLDSVSASRIAKVLHEIAHDPVNPIPVIASIHQPRWVPLFPYLDVKF